MSEQNAHVKTRKKQSPVKMIIFAAILIIAAIFGTRKIVYALHHEETDNAQIETQITPVLPRVGGYVKQIAVNDYDSVKAGELLVGLDDEELQEQLTEMEADYAQSLADLENAKAQLNNAIISLKVNKGNIDINNIRKSKSYNDFERDKSLYEADAITKKQLDESSFNLQTTLKQLENSQHDLQTAQSRIDVLKAGIKKAEAVIQLKKAKIEQQQLKISYTKITAPQGGKLGKKNISLGQFVQAGTPLFSIVNDTTYWVVANFKETQIRKFHEGMPVNIELDAFPDVHIAGTVESLSEATGARFSLLPPDNASGNFVKVTQRVPVKIRIDKLNDYRQYLRAGLSVNVSVPVK